MVRDISPRGRDCVALLQSAQPKIQGPAPAPQTETAGAFGVIHEKRHGVKDVAALDGKRAIHIGLAEGQVRAQGQTRGQAAAMEPKRKRGTRLRAGKLVPFAS